MAELFTGYQQTSPEQETIERLPANPSSALDLMLARALRSGASDLHLQGGQRPHIRVDGALVVMPNCLDPQSSDERHLSHELVDRIASTLVSGDEAVRFLAAAAVARHNRLETMQSRTEMEEAIARAASAGYASIHGFDADVSYQLMSDTQPVPVARFRVNISIVNNATRIVMRQIPTRIKTMADLALPEVMYSLGRLKNGLVLVTGPTGSGKTTTLAAILDQINETRNCSILTIEDPIEFVHSPKRSLVSQREVGRDVPSFAEALRRALRQDPDVILVGEMRDLETTRIALEAAETGHLVFATLHTKSAAETVTRIINQYPASEQEQIRMTLASALRAVVSQTLVRRRTGGRVAALEIMRVTPAISSQLRTAQAASSIEDTILSTQSEGNILLNSSLAELVRTKVISTEDALLASNRPEDLAIAIRGMG